MPEVLCQRPYDTEIVSVGTMRLGSMVFFLRADILLIPESETGCTLIMSSVEHWLPRGSVGLKVEHYVWTE